MQDIVIDTNVWAHAGNAQEPRQSSAIALIEALLATATLVCVDSGFDAVESRNRSQIWSEYLARIPEATLGRLALANLLQAGRIREVARQVNPHAARKIRNAVHDPTDRVFVKVALNTVEQVLVSHDTAAFTPSAKLQLSELGIDAIDAAMAAAAAIAD